VAARLPLVDKPVSIRFLGLVRYFESMKGISSFARKSWYLKAPGKL
jgi:hypothetical protein